MRTTARWQAAPARNPRPAALLAAFVLAWTASLAPGHALASPDAAGSVRVATERVEPRPRDLVLPDKVGILQAAASLDLGFEVSGRVERILGQGAHVEQGGEIAALDDELEEAELRRATLLVREAEAELDRVAGLRQSRAASESALDTARTAVGLRRAERDSAIERLARRRLEARFDGVVADVRIDPGEIAAPGVVIARLLNFELMKIEVGVPGHQIGLVDAGALVVVEVPALPGRAFPGQVHHVAPSTATGSALFEVEIIIPNGDGLLKPGMSARASVVTRRVEQAIAIPLEAVVERNRRRVVFFVEDGRASERGVDDATLQGDILILPDVTTPRTLVVRGQHDLHDGVAVTVDNTILTGLPPATRAVSAEVVGP